MPLSGAKGDGTPARIRPTGELTAIKIAQLIFPHQADLFTAGVSVRLPGRMGNAFFTAYFALFIVIIPRRPYGWHGVRPTTW